MFIILFINFRYSGINSSPASSGAYFSFDTQFRRQFRAPAPGLRISPVAPLYSGIYTPAALFCPHLFRHLSALRAAAISGAGGPLRAVLAPGRGAGHFATLIFIPIRARTAATLDFPAIHCWQAPLSHYAPAFVAPSDLFRHYAAGTIYCAAFAFDRQAAVQYGHLIIPPFYAAGVLNNFAFLFSPGIVGVNCSRIKRCRYYFNGSSAHAHFARIASRIFPQRRFITASDRTIASHQFPAAHITQVSAIAFHITYPPYAGSTPRVSPGQFRAPAFAFGHVAGSPPRKLFRIASPGRPQFIFGPFARPITRPQPPHIPLLQFILRFAIRVAAGLRHRWHITGIAMLSSPFRALMPVPLSGHSLIIACHLYAIFYTFIISTIRFRVAALFPHKYAIRSLYLVFGSAHAGDFQVSLAFVAVAARLSHIFVSLSPPRR